MIISLFADKSKNPMMARIFSILSTFPPKFSITVHDAGPSDDKIN